MCGFRNSPFQARPQLPLYHQPYRLEIWACQCNAIPWLKSIKNQLPLV